MEQSQHKTYKKYDIERFYNRTRQGQFGNTYYVEPSDMCPLDILKVQDRFIILTFDKKDDYIVVGGRRYYLNHTNSIKCTDKQELRVAVVDLKALKKSKSYVYDDKYHHKHTLEVDSFEDLAQEAKRQYSFNGLPYIRQVAKYDPQTKTCQYIYEPSFQSVA